MYIMNITIFKSRFGYKYTIEYEGFVKIEESSYFNDISKLIENLRQNIMKNVQEIFDELAKKKEVIKRNDIIKIKL